MKRTLFLIAAVTVAATVHAEVIPGKVIHVEDGDTVTVRSDAGANFVVRLADIDAPESCHRQHDAGCNNRPGQPFGRRAGEEMARMVLRRPIQADCNPDPDPYGRKICSILVDGESAGAKLVELGYAWLYRTHSHGTLRIKTKRQDLIALEERARSERRGLWALPNPVYPGQWRKLCWEAHQCDGKGDD